MKIPNFQTLDEAVEFWETHDSADYFDDLEPLAFEVDIHQNLLHPRTTTLAYRPNRCPRCKSELDDTRMDYADWSDGRLRIVRDIPALRCRLNKHEYLLEEELERVEQVLLLEKEHLLQPVETITVPVYDLVPAA